MASKIPYDTSAAALFSPAKNAVFFKDWQPAVDNQNHDLLCAEMSRLAYAEQGVIAAALSSIGFATVGFVDVRGAQGFVAKNLAQDLTVLAFRGTESNNLADLVTDLNTLQTNFRDAGRVHTGFFNAYELVRTQVATLLEKRSGSLFLTGHSLGAALATLTATDAQPTGLITFGSPHVGDAEFRRLFDDRMVRRFVNCCDVVARIPPEQFDREHLLQLLTELSDFERFPSLTRLAAKAGAKAAAELLTKPFLAGAATTKYEHIAPPRYIRAQGTVAEASDGEEIAQDQQAARVAYRDTVEIGVGQLLKLFESLRADRSSLRSLSDFFRGDPVPLRDLADHAPINYLSAFTGRQN